MMGAHRIATIAGDGIGKEVVAEGVRVVKAAAEATGCRFDFEDFSWGSEHYLAHGRMMPDDALDRLAGFDAIYLGAVGHPQVPDHTTLNGLLLPIRRTFEQYANVRPSMAYPRVPTPLAAPTAREIDLVLVRENTEGEYTPAGGSVHVGTGDEVALQTAVFTRRGTERIVRFAFDLARTRRKRLTSITKSNAQGHSMTFWDRVFREVSADYPDVRTDSLLVDAAAMELIRRPHTFDVIVASNLFGDILSEIAATVTGSLGLAPSANLNPPRKHPSMFEPVHGSAPDIAGRGVANPIGAVLSAEMMVDWLGEPEAARGIRRAVVRLLSEGRALTADVGGSASTHEVGDELVRLLRQGGG